MTILDAMWQVTLELAPWLLLGAAIAGVLHVWLPTGFVRRHLGGKWGVVKAVALGVPLPLCSCGVIPAGLGLKRDGASDGAAVGFLISTPQTGVDSILVSAMFLGWPFAVFKVASAAVTGFVGGWITDALGESSSPEPEAPMTEEGAKGPRVRAAAEHGLDMLRTIWGWLLFGVVASAAIHTWMPPSSYSLWTDLGPLGTALSALAISVPLYVCATASVPIAAALVAGGLPAGAALVFLMAGPATNVATIGAVKRALGGKVLVVYLATIILGSLGLGLAFDAVLDATATVTPDLHGSPAWWQTGSAWVSVALMVWFLGEDLRDRWGAGSGEVQAGSAQQVGVDGMTCDSCVRKLRTALQAADGVIRADVTLEPGQAQVHGTISEADLHDLIQQTGYRVRSVH